MPVRGKATKPRSTDVAKHKSPTDRAAEAMVKATSTGIDVARTSGSSEETRRCCNGVCNVGCDNPPDAGSSHILRGVDRTLSR